MAVDSLVGRSFAGYRIERRLGRGGMSVVYLAQHPRLKSGVALKLLAPDLATDDELRQRLLRESQLAASLNHPNVIPIFDTGEEDGTVFIAMRYVQGRDLRELLAERRPSLDEVASLVDQIAAALDAAHARGLVHRDVKPANVLIEEGGTPPGHVYVADFGLTKQLDARSGVTASGQFVGTVDYMAPEQIQGKAVDARTDVYALGCVLYECLTGRLPFQRENDVAVIWAHMREEPEPPTEVDRRLPRSMDAVIARCLAKSPDDRYATAGELAADVRVAVADRRRRSSPVTRLARLRRRRVRMRRRWARPALAGLVVGAGIATAVALATRSTGGGTQLTAQDRTLLSLVPVALRPTCGHAQPPTPDFTASVVCKPGGAVDSVTYSVSLSASRMRAHVLGDKYAIGVGRPGKSIQARGECGQTPVTVRDWGETPSGRRLQLSRRTPGKPLGTILCYSGVDWAAIEWTDTRVDVSAIAYGRSQAGVFHWWLTRGGPLPEPTAS